MALFPSGGSENSKGLVTLGRPQNLGGSGDLASRRGGVLGHRVSVP